MPKAKKTKTFAMLARSASLSEARKDKVLKKIDKPLIDPKTGVLLRGSILKVKNGFKALNHWLSRDMITSKQKRQKKVADAIAAEEVKKQPAQKKTKTTTPLPIEELSPAPYSSWKKGTTLLAKRVRDFKFASMKNTIVRVWANKEIWPNMTLNKWIIRNQEIFGFNPEKP